MSSTGTPLPPPPTEPVPPSPEPPRLPGRYANLEQHELVRLLDSVDDEVARARFRESIYISLLICVAIAWFLFYGPTVILRQPKLRDPLKVLSDRELALNAPPDLVKKLAREAQKPPALNKQTMKQLEQMQKAESAERAARPAPAPTPAAEAPKPAAQPQQAPAQQAPPSPVNAPPTNAPAPNVPPAPQPKPVEQAMADAPKPQPTKPNFGMQQSAGEAIKQAAHDAAQNHAGSGTGSIQDAPRRGGGAQIGAGYEILSDTQGVDFDPYLKRILRQIEAQWRSLLPAEIQPPISKAGVTELRFSILPDGHLQVGGMVLENSTHDDALNKAAWGSITSSNPFPPLPSQFHGPVLTLRIHYLVNQTHE